jgi:ribosomal protein S12 methylthiotransferase
MISLGCAKNLVDTEVMLGHLDRAGCAFVKDPSEADVIVVNTCSFIDAAREESVQTILEAAELKKTGNLKRLVVAGCMVQRYADELRESLPEVDAFVGLDQLEQIVDRAAPQAPRTTPAAGEVPHSPLHVLPASPAGGARVDPAAVASTSPPWGASTRLYDERSPRRLATPAWSAYLKIAEGCDHTCAFCAIPTFRGAFRSRRLGSILREARSLVDGGVKEINLIAQDSSHFGRDLGLTDGLARLLEGLDEIEGLRWIRLHYLYPNTVNERLIETMARLEKVVKYVDIPLQHADRATLQRMRRGGSAESHLALLSRFREAMPDAAVRSTFIVGFPGESDAEFESLIEFVEGARFDHLGVFTYSHEERTHAHALEDDVPPQVKQERRDRIMEAQQAIVAQHNEARIGRQVEVLVEGAHPETEHLLVGRMPTQAMDVDGQVLLNEGHGLPGDFVRVELTGIAGYDVVGTILGPA